MRRPDFLCAAAAALLALTLSLAGCSSAPDPWEDEPGSPRVVVTIAPLYSLVRGVAGDRAAVKCLCTTTGPHHYQLDTRDARVLGKANLFLAVGLRLDDSFADGMRSVARRPDLPYVKLGQKLPDGGLLELQHEHHHHGDGDHAHHHGKWDPHVWLGLPEAVEMVNVIRDALSKIDPVNASEYANNAAGYITRLEKLRKDGRALMGNKAVRRIISFHEALGYFARTFDLEIADVIETAAGREPSAQHLAGIVDRCKKSRDEKRPIGAIAVEPQYPRSTSAAAVQKELKKNGIDLPLVEVDPLETADLAELKREAGDWYLTRMRKNLEALAKALP